MNQTSLRSSFGSTPQLTADAMQARFALRVASAMTERSAQIAPDVAERLRFAREKALERAREVRIASAAGTVGLGSGGGAAVLGRLGSGWWMKAASALPVVALAAGLFLIQHWQDNSQISVAAEVDAALLADDLPPQAYSDAGFAEFLKTPGE
jgi:Protein of unknown function (DUF3619)